MNWILGVSIALCIMIVTSFVMFFLEPYFGVLNFTGSLLLVLSTIGIIYLIMFTMDTP